jgi:DnaJ-class molecular chaperone
MMTLRATPEGTMAIKGVVVEEKCETCLGTGVVKGAVVSFIECKACQGNGFLRRCMPLPELRDLLARTVPASCDACGGTGNTEGIPMPGGPWVDCPKCRPATPVATSAGL